jgi:hypothetical protein
MVLEGRLRRGPQDAGHPSPPGALGLAASDSFCRDRPCAHLRYFAIARAQARAAIATSLTVGAVPAEAHRGGLNERHVRQIVKEEVAKVQRIRGPAGPKGQAGPPGMDGNEFPMLFAFVGPFGTGDRASHQSA